LILLTNDGELAQRLMHPRFGVKKVYQVKLSACPTEIELGRLRKGIRLEDGMTAPARVRVLEKLKKNAWIEIELHEGRNREVRRMFETLGYFVEKLIRVRIGNVELGRLALGEIRPLMRTEIIKLKRVVGLQDRPSEPERPERRRRAGSRR
jgi:23S rRNA pseudouridine2605 synthase